MAVNSQLPEFHQLAPGFPGRLTGLRDGADLTQAQLAHEVGVALSAINAWEKDRRPPEGAVALLRLSERLGVSVDYLLTGREAPGVESIVLDLGALLAKATRILRGSPDIGPSLATEESVDEERRGNGTDEA